MSGQPVRDLEVTSLRTALSAGPQLLHDNIAYFDYLEAPAGLVLLEDGTPYACYLACTHFGCIVQWRTEDQDWYCPCHAGVFSPDGEVIAGPPPSPLVALNVVVEGDVLYVEGTVETEEG